MQHVVHATQEKHTRLTIPSAALVAWASPVGRCQPWVGVPVGKTAGETKRAGGGAEEGGGSSGWEDDPPQPGNLDSTNPKKNSYTYLANLRPGIHNA